MILIYGTCVKGVFLRCFFFHVLKMLIFGIISKGIIMSVSLCTLDTVHHMIVMFRTHVYNNDIPTNLYHFKIFIFGVLGA